MEDERIQRMRDVFRSVQDRIPIGGPIRAMVQTRIGQFVERGPNDPIVRQFLEIAQDGTKRHIMLGAALEVENEDPNEEVQKERKKNVKEFFEKFTPEHLGFKSPREINQWNNMTSLYNRESVEALDDDENIEPESETESETESEMEGSGMFRIGWKP
mgnify:CR=1 FL=1